MPVAWPLVVLLGAFAAPNSADSDAILAAYQQRAIAYFWAEADPRTGLVKDRAANFADDTYTVSSLAATGFGLAALSVAAERGFLPAADARERARVTLTYLLAEMPHEHGWYYHFVDMRTGERAWECELSSIDTALLIAGALTAGSHFGGEIETLADRLYARVDFQWMLTDGGEKPDSTTLSHGWKPESGFLRSRWDSYSEHMILYLLAIGSPTHPIPPATWEAWDRPEGAYGGYTTFRVGPLFTHQFSHAFVEFRGLVDGGGRDYWETSVNATLANRQFCMDNADSYQTYDADLWGLSACDGPDGYRAYSAPPGREEHDGTVAILATLASLPFAPEQVGAFATRLMEKGGERVWGKYGFTDAVNLDREFWAPDVIGIDVGAAVLMIENHRSGAVWGAFGRVPAVREAMASVGFHTASPSRCGDARNPHPSLPPSNGEGILSGPRTDACADPVDGGHPGTDAENGSRPSAASACDLFRR